MSKPNTPQPIQAIRNPHYNATSYSPGEDMSEPRSSGSRPLEAALVAQQLIIDGLEASLDQLTDRLCCLLQPERPSGDEAPDQKTAASSLLSPPVSSMTQMVKGNTSQISSLVDRIHRLMAYLDV